MNHIHSYCAASTLLLGSSPSPSPTTDNQCEDSNVPPPSCSPGVCEGDELWYTAFQEKTHPAKPDYTRCKAVGQGGMMSRHYGNSPDFTRNWVLESGRISAQFEIQRREDTSKSTSNCHPGYALRSKCYGIIPHLEIREDTLSCLTTGRQRAAALVKQSQEET